MHGMRVVAFERRGVGKFHRAAELVPLSAWRNIQADPRFLHFLDFVFQLSNFGDAMIFLLAGHATLESKRKHMDVHDRSLHLLEIRAPSLADLKSSLAIFRDHTRNVNIDCAEAELENFPA